jgi:hypothetical protein
MSQWHATLLGSISLDAILYRTAERSTTQVIARGNEIYSPDGLSIHAEEDVI